MGTQERVSKILSACGVCSRRAAEALIEAGRVRVNGVQAELGQKADAETDEICVDGKRLSRSVQFCYLMLHKPRGYVTTVRDEKGRRTVMDLVAEVPERLWPVGRLDMDSEGLLLLTNDGAMTNHLLHPKHEVDKTYHVWVRGSVRPAVRQLRSMKILDGEPILRPNVHLLEENAWGGVLSVVIHEGKNRQVRRMCAACALEVLRLRRVQEGPVSLGDLPVGKWRPLTDEEVALLRGEEQELS